MKKIAIIGAGGFGREVLTIIDHINKKKPQFNFIGFFDDSISKGTVINNYEVLGKVEDINTITEETCIVIAVGDPIVKKEIRDRINNEYILFPTLIHPSVIIGDDKFVKIGIGCIVCAGVIITTNIIIDDFVILNLSCTIGHDSIIGKHSSFMPSVNISGEVEIKPNVYIGTGTKIINQLNIGENTIVGAGAVVAKSLPANCTAVGIPAKVIKYH